jgi:hypothetical protein
MFKEEETSPTGPLSEKSPEEPESVKAHPVLIFTFHPVTGEITMDYDKSMSIQDLYKTRLMIDELYNQIMVDREIATLNHMRQLGTKVDTLLAASRAVLKEISKGSNKNE